MPKSLKCLLLAAVAGMALTFAAPPQEAAAQVRRVVPAERYWDGYWRWYDTRYRPFFHRRQFRAWDDPRFIDPWDRRFIGVDPRFDARWADPWRTPRHRTRWW